MTVMIQETPIEIVHYWSSRLDHRDWCFFWTDDGVPYLACEDDA